MGGPPMGGPPMGGPMHGAPPQKKGCSTGCWIAIAIVGALVLIVGGVVGYGAWTVYNDPDVKKALGVIGDGLDIYNDAKDADGVKELGKAGCNEPLVFNVKKLFDFAEKHSKEDFDRPDLKIDRLVLCNTKKKSLTCADLAEEYVDAASPKKGFGVIINYPDSTQCSEQFDKKGKSEGKFASDSVPIPQKPKPSAADGQDEDEDEDEED